MDIRKIYVLLTAGIICGTSLTPGRTAELTRIIKPKPGIETPSESPTPPPEPSEESLEFMIQFDGKTTVKEAVYNALLENNRCIINQDLDDLAFKIKKQKGWLTRNTRFQPGELTEEERTFYSDLIPEHYLVDEMDLRIEIVKSDFNLKLIQTYNGEDIVHVDTSISIGRPGHETPEGNFYIKRVVWEPRWFPYDEKKYSKKLTEPGPENAFGIVMVELCRTDSPIGYGFIDSKDDTIKRIHSCPPSRIWTTSGTTESGGCVRVHPDMFGKMCRFMENYTLCRESKKTYRGNRVVPFSETVIRVSIE